MMKLLQVFICAIWFFLFVPMCVAEQQLSSSNESRQKYQVEQISAEIFQKQVKRIGRLSYKEIVNLSFKTGGYLELLAVDEGMVFKSERVLAKLDDFELTADKNAKYAALLQAKRDVKRQEELLNGALGSQSQLDLAQTQLKTQRAAFRVAEYNLTKAKIIAPFDGVVLATHAEINELQAPGMAVLTVAPVQNNWAVLMSLTSDEIAAVSLDQQVSVYLNDFKQTVTGVISQLPGIANPKSGLFDIEISLLANPNMSNLIAGKTVEVTLVLQGKHRVYAVPIKALTEIDKQGQAVIAIELADQQIVKKSFDIHAFDNDVIYLLAGDDSHEINVVTQGWQHLQMAE